MINVFFLKDHEDHRKGDQAHIERVKAIGLLLDGTVETNTAHIERIDNKPDESEKPKRKKIKKEIAVSKRVQKREKAVNE